MNLLTHSCQIGPVRDLFQIPFPNRNCIQTLSKENPTADTEIIPQQKSVRDSSPQLIYSICSISLRRWCRLKARQQYVSSCGYGAMRLEERSFLGRACSHTEWVSWGLHGWLRSQAHSVMSPVLNFIVKREEAKGPYLFQRWPMRTKFCNAPAYRKKKAWCKKTHDILKCASELNVLF